MRCDETVYEEAITITVTIDQLINIADQVGKKRTLTVGGSVTVWLVVSSLTRLDLTKAENMSLLLCSEAVESKLLKLETSRTATLLPTVSVLC